MGNIGEPGTQKEIELEPFPESAPLEPAVPEPVPQEEPVG